MLIILFCTENKNLIILYKWKVNSMLFIYWNNPVCFFTIDVLKVESLRCHLFCLSHSNSYLNSEYKNVWKLLFQGKFTLLKWTKYAIQYQFRIKKVLWVFHEIIERSLINQSILVITSSTNKNSVNYSSKS